MEMTSLFEYRDNVPFVGHYHLYLIRDSPFRVGLYNGIAFHAFEILVGNTITMCGFPGQIERCIATNVHPSDIVFDYT